MTAVVHHGFSGSYKSFAIVQSAIIPALIGVPLLDSDGKKTFDELGNLILKGRTVVTNIRGLNSIPAIESALGVEVHKDSKIIYVDPDGGTRSWDLMRVWFHWAPIGALIALDETAKIYSITRNKDLKEFDLPLFTLIGDRNEHDFIKTKCPHWDGDFERPEDLETAIDMHRHYHWDLYYSCTNITKLHKYIRDNVEAAYRHKPLGSFIPFFFKNSWKEFQHDASNNGQSTNNYIAPPTVYRADLRIFQCYLSTKDGKAKLSPENNSIFRNPKFLFIIFAILVSMYFIISRAGDLLQDTPIPDQVSEVDTQADLNLDSQTPNSVDNNDSRWSSSPPRSSPPSLETPLLVNDVLDLPFGYKINDTDRFRHYLSGDFRIYIPLTVLTQTGLHFTINVEKDGQFLESFNHSDLEFLGYRVTPSNNGLALQRSNDTYYIQRSPPTKPAQLSSQPVYLPTQLPQDQPSQSTQTILKNGLFQ